MKRNMALLISVIFLVMPVLGMVAAAQADSGCSLATLQGAYGISVTGFTQGIGAGAATAASRPGAQVGIITFDGAGGFFQEFATQSNNGTIFSFSGPAGTYTVNPNCTGSATTANGETANFIIVDEGREALVIFTFSPFSPGQVTTAMAIKTGDQECSVATLNGTYGISTTGFFQGTGAAAATIASLPFASVGIITLNGVGGFSLEAKSNTNGTISPFAQAGTYTVNPDCTGSALNAAGTNVANFVIVARGKEVLGISTTPGTVQTFVALKTGD